MTYKEAQEFANCVYAAGTNGDVEAWATYERWRNDHRDTQGSANWLIEQRDPYAVSFITAIRLGA